MDTRADIELFIFLIKQEEKNDMQYKFIAKTELLISSKKESTNKLVWSGLLDKGVYVLIPSTTGCIFTKRKIQPSSDLHLTEIDDLTGKKHALKKYDQFSLNISCFWGSIPINKYHSCAISRNSCLQKW